MIESLPPLQPNLHPTAVVLRGAVVLGDVSLAAESSVFFGAVLRGDVNHIRIGARTNIQDRTVIHVSSQNHPTLVGEDVTIGHAAVVHGCVVGDRSLIGIGATVMDGCEIGEDCLVGAGALVTPGTVIPAGSLVLGQPGRVARSLRAQELENLRRTARNYVELAKRYREAGMDENALPAG